VDYLVSYDKAKKIVISAFFLFHLVVTVSGAIPPDFLFVNALHAKMFLTSLTRNLGRYHAIVGLQVGWNMFAPNPPRDNSYVEAEIRYADGRQATWRFPQMQELGYGERYARERYRRFAGEELWLSKNSALWREAARYIARLNNNVSNPARCVELVHYWAAIPSPQRPGAEPPSERFRREVFFYYTVDPPDLR
jgi:hypothetical protein